MPVCETHLDTSGFYHTALETLMEGLHISSTPNLEPSRCNNSFRRHFTSADENKFFSFCSTIKQHSKSENVTRNKRLQDKQQSNEINQTPLQNARDTPKRPVTTTRKQKLFESTKPEEEFKLNTRSSLHAGELSPQSLLLKKAITRYECLQRRQEKIALSKKPVRTSLRV